MESAYYYVNGKERKFEELYNFNDIWEYGMLFKYDGLFGLYYKLTCNSDPKYTIDINAESDDDAINQVREMFEDWIEEFNYNKNDDDDDE